MKLALSKLTKVAVLSLVCMVMGVGCITWAVINIWKQSNYSNGNGYLATAKVEEKDEETEKNPRLSTTETPLYPEYSQKGDDIGSLSIPVLEQTLPIIQGTDEEELKKGVGHFMQSVFPGEEDNCVLSGHRDTVFLKLGKLKLGDQLIVQTSSGTYTYEIEEIRIVDKDDKTVIVPTDHAVLTLTTCYPFSYIGTAPERYILSADLVSKK